MFGTTGDLICEDEKCPFLFEIKWREGWNFVRLFESIETGNSKDPDNPYKFPVWNWWKQAQDEADPVHKIPALVFKQNKMPWHIMLPAEALPAWRCNSIIYINHPTTCWIESRDVVVIRLAEFCEKFPPKEWEDNVTQGHLQENKEAIPDKTR